MSSQQSRSICGTLRDENSWKYHVPVLSVPRDIIFYSRCAPPWNALSNFFCLDLGGGGQKKIVAEFFSGPPSLKLWPLTYSIICRLNKVTKIKPSINAPVLTQIIWCKSFTLFEKFFRDHWNTIERPWGKGVGGVGRWPAKPVLEQY